MKIIVALGNPGEKYENTRHNVGFLLADSLANRWGGSFSFESKFKAEFAKCSFGSEQILVLKPQTYMNLSGECLRLVLNFYKLTQSDFIVVYDDIATNLGGIRFRPNGSDGGHNGIKSIINAVSGKNFDRLKIGIGPQPAFLSSEAYVLQNFPADEKEILSEVIEKSINALECYFLEGISAAQNKFNCK